MIHLAVINESTQITDHDIESMLFAFSTQWNSHLKPVWGVDDGRFVLVRPGRKPPKRSWWIVFLDNTDDAEALAYHDLTNEGMPIAKVFVETLRESGASVSAGATHEICEMAVDPWLNGAFQDPKGSMWASEVCDPVEADRYGYKIGGVLVTNFVTPGWFGHEYTEGALDFRGHVHEQFQVLPEGYSQRLEGRRGWVQVNGSSAHRSLRASEAVTGSRRERRRRLAGREGIRSEATFRRKAR